MFGLHVIDPLLFIFLVWVHIFGEQCSAHAVTMTYWASVVCISVAVCHWTESMNIDEYLVPIPLNRNDHHMIVAISKIEGNLNEIGLNSNALLIIDQMPRNPIISEFVRATGYISVV